MPNWIEFRLAVQGVLRLARFNSDFVRFFDRSPQGALRSFWLAVPVYPYYLLQIWPSDPQHMPTDMVQFVTAMSVGYALLWIVPPLAVASLAPFIGRRAEVPGCICAYNWMTLLGVTAFAPILLLSLSGVPDQTMQVPNNLVLLVTLVWETFLLIHTLRLAIWQAGLATLADFVVTQWVLLPVLYTVGGGT